MRFGLRRFWGARSIQTSIVRLFQDKHSRPEALARFIALARRIRERCLNGNDFFSYGKRREVA